MNDFVKIINENLLFLKGKKVILYGTGAFAKKLVNNKASLCFSIEALLDGTRKDGFLWRLPILDVKDAENLLRYADHIVIAASLESCKIIYDRISHIEERGISISYPNGNRPALKSYEEAASFIRYLKKLEYIKASIIDYDVISFDVFDTLIMRKCLYPEMIFDLIELKHDLSGFKAKRIEHQSLLENNTLDDIYNGLHASFLHAEMLKEEELFCEKQMSIVRHDIFDIFEHAKKLGKKVILVSDMYLSQNHVHALLKSNNIIGYDSLYISCEAKGKKSDGSIWKEICSKHPEQRILHIGDNDLSDYFMVYDSDENKCICAEKILSPVQLLEAFGFSDAIASAHEINDYITLGLIVNRIMKNLTSCTMIDGKILIKSPVLEGYIFFAPIVYAFSSWIMKQAIENNENILLFYSRDGYVLEKVCHQIKKSLNAVSPDLRYFYTSRRAVNAAGIETMEDLKKVLKTYWDFKKALSVRQFLFNVIGVDIGNDNFSQTVCINITFEYLCQKIADQYLAIILDHTERERKNYRAYIEKLAIGKYNKIATVDLVTSLRGHVVMREKILEREFHALCYARLDTSFTHVSFLGEHNVKSFLPGIHNQSLSKYNVISNLYRTEAVLTSKEGQLMHFDQYGNPVFSDEKRELSYIIGIHEGIYSYVSDMLRAIPWRAGAPNKEFADILFGIPLSSVYASSEGAGSALAVQDDFSDKIKWIEERKIKC